MIRAVVSDFGGVLTSPLLGAFVAVHAHYGVEVDALRAAMALQAARGTEPPLFRLERGELSEPEFVAGLEAALTEVLERPVALPGYGERLMAALEPNEELFAYYRGLRDAGVRLAMLTNNVREWEPLWRRKLPIDDVFELVVDSGFVGMRKPEPGIYALTLERLDLPPGDCAFVDDLELNVEAARAIGMHGVVFRDTTQAVVELDALLANQLSEPSRSQQ